MTPPVCPKCGSANTQGGGKRHAVYPAGCLMGLGLLAASLHQAQAPVEFRCGDCGHGFAKRTIAAKVALAFFVAVLTLIVLAAVGEMVAALVGMPI